MFYGSIHMDVQVLDDQLELLQQLWIDGGCSLEDLPEVMDERCMSRESGGNLC